MVYALATKAYLFNTTENPSQSHLGLQCSPKPWPLAFSDLETYSNNVFTIVTHLTQRMWISIYFVSMVLLI